MVKKKVTIEDLARITYKGFQDMGGRFQKVDERFERLEKRMDDLTDALTRFIKATESNFGHVYARLDRIREDVSDLPAIRSELHSLRSRVEKLERKV